MKYRVTDHDVTDAMRVEFAPDTEPVKMNAPYSGKLRLYRPVFMLVTARRDTTKEGLDSEFDLNWKVTCKIALKNGGNGVSEVVFNSWSVPTQVRAIFDNVAAEVWGKANGTKVISYLRAENKDLQTRFDDLVNGVLDHAPECWDDDVAPEAIALDFVASLLTGSTDMPGHANGCTCFE